MPADRDYYELLGVPRSATEAEVKKYTQNTELFGWLVAGGLALLLVEVTLGQTVFRRLP